jgi:hypothetical protein
VTTGQLNAPAVDGDTTHRNWREGARAGLFGASVGALWSLLVDLVAGHPFETWTFLGAELLSLLGPAGPPRPVVAVVVFLAFVALVFMVLGRIAIVVAHRADAQPYMILVANFILTLIVLAIVAIAAAFQNSRLGGEAWLQIFGSPLIALWALGFLIYRTHPSLASDFKNVRDA